MALRAHKWLSMAEAASVALVQEQGWRSGLFHGFVVLSFIHGSQQTAVVRLQHLSELVNVLPRGAEELYTRCPRLRRSIQQEASVKTIQ